MIQTEALHKAYGKFVAVHDVTLHVRKGEVFGFLGPNGAVKTTTMKMVAGMLKPSAGRVLVDGIDLSSDPVAAKAIIGYIPDRPYLYERLTAREFLSFVGGIYGMEEDVVSLRSTELLPHFGLGGVEDNLVESYSHGMKQRLTLAAALLHRPRLLIVDEPMVGLDPAGARLIKEVFRELARDGHSVFLSTHTLEVADAICDRVAIINQGSLVTVGSPAELKREHNRTDGRLEDVFLQLVGGPDQQEVLRALRGDSGSAP